MPHSQSVAADYGALVYTSPKVSMYVNNVPIE